MKSAKNPPCSDVRVNSDIRDEAEYCFIPPHPRDADDPMRLSLRVQERLKHYFLKRNLTWLSGLREMMNGAIEAILQACPGSVTAIPFQPGLGKSTLIRALLEECSEEFRNQTPIAQRIGGILPNSVINIQKDTLLQGQFLPSMITTSLKASASMSAPPLMKNV